MLLYVSTLIGDYVEEHVVAGGLVPALIVPQDQLPEGAERHVGTRDLAIVMLVFGVGRIGKVAGEMGCGIRAFREGLEGDGKKEEEGEKPAAEAKAEEAA